MEYKLLLELYKYIKLSNTIISIDPRGDRSLKMAMIFDIKKSLENNSLSEEKIDKFEEGNKMLLEYFLNPLIIDKQSKEFYEKYPDAIF